MQIKKRRKSPSIFGFTFILTILGIIALADISAPQGQSFFSDPFYFVKQQAIWVGLGLVAFIVASYTPYSLWKKISPFLFILNVILLIMVLIPGLGTKFLGARRWLIFGPISIQPSELSKLTLGLFLAYLLDKKTRILFAVIPIALVAALIMFEPDLGTTLVVLGIGFSQLFISGIALTAFLAAIAVGIGLVTPLVLLSSYRRERLMTFINGITDPLGTSYHIRQILFALGSGGLLGVGLGNSRQKFLFLPESSTDSIFAIIAEEIGYLGAGLVIILFVIYIYKLIWVAGRAPDTFSKIFVIGIAGWIMTQTFLNIGSMVAAVPLTGVPLPFFSYGGSAITALLFSLGIVNNIARNSPI